MLIVYFFICILAKDGLREWGVFERYQALLKDHEKCVETLADTRSTLAGTRSTVKTYEDRIINGLQREVDVLKKELSAVVSQQKELTKSVTDGKVRDESLKEKIDAVVKGRLTEKVYFSALTYTAIPSNVPIPFSVISENESGFNGQTGVMTVKIAGTYFWNCQFLTNGMQAHVVLMHNNGKCTHKVADSFNNKKDGHYMISLMSTRVFEQNDKVWVEMRSGRLWYGKHEYNQCTAFKIA